MNYKYKLVALLAGILFFVSCSETQNEKDNMFSTLLSLLEKKEIQPNNKKGFHYSDLALEEDPSDATNTDSENLLPSSPTYIFLAPAHHGGLGGIYGADEWCMRKVPADLKGSPYYSYKALLADGINRRASVAGNAGDGQINWVLQANTVYSQATTGTPTIGTTNSKKLFTFPLTNKIRPDSITDLGGVTWTGLNPNWTTAPYNCNNWTDGADINAGTIGNYNSITSDAIFNSALIVPGLTTCSTGGKLYCVEQPVPPLRFFKYIYLAPLSPIGHNGNYGGIAGMDSICNNDTMKPVELLGKGTYKAMAVDQAITIPSTPATRRATPNPVNWVLRPNTSYKRLDGAPLFTTDANGLFSSMTNEFGEESEGNGFIWTGLNSDFTTATGNNCNNWKSSASNYLGRIGSANTNVKSVALSYTNRPCNQTTNSSEPIRIVCVEQ
ncbi:endostatin-like outer membrane lipoprotein LenD [Leptospira kirschneri]|uniref:endostatin-like outer membrane lipoprotein LenD n=1 Tax=Leptospira kirschneri TaxID=29507 RepID=UPI0002785F4D|nr:DUF1554 domain-containing protein [Leptospira kirschneri]EJO68883.1 PF07588 family protein [Leptospira kirschneri serovar Grippotyphosa str. RM52]EMK06195.1 PF07588 family protein [Leptospira kirschneri str. MMD1493]EMK12797.1 PF07588 family protein [Leptospira kirschneri serovar Bim str. PUO 1247]EMN04942.1 PF07588 family protein [Leptospira kirschneri serovar Bim str. 1051]EMO81211.1 PF07588 family protein [Leptospira kirschneri str. 200801774]